MKNISVSIIIFLIGIIFISCSSNEDVKVDSIKEVEEVVVDGNMLVEKVNSLISDLASTTFDKSLAVVSYDNDKVVVDVPISTNFDYSEELKTVKIKENIIKACLRFIKKVDGLNKIQIKTMYGSTYYDLTVDRELANQYLNTGSGGIFTRQLDEKVDKSNIDNFWSEIGGSTY